MATRGSRNNVLAGAFLLISLALGVTVVIVLSDLPERLTPKERYTIRFPLAEGTEGLTEGSLVKVGGQVVGRVSALEFVPAEPAGVVGNGANAGGPKGVEPVAVDVEVDIRSDLRLYEDAVVQLVVPLLGSGSMINIPWAGDGSRLAGAYQGTGPVLEPGERMTGHIAPSAVLQATGIHEPQVAQIQDIIRRMANVTANIEELTTPGSPLLAGAEGAIDDVRAITGSVKESLPGWTERVDSVLTRVDDAAEQFGPLLDEAGAGMTDARGAIGDVRGMIGDNRPRIDRTLLNVESLTEKANTEGWRQISAMLDGGRATADEARDAMERVNALVKEQTPELRQILANARLASDQLKITMTEVRAAPWKLLSKPTGRKELENEALYDAARQAVLAASDLRAAAASLESVAAGTDRDAPSAIEEESLRALVGDLETALRRYQDTERAFMERLTGGRN